MEYCKNGHLRNEVNTYIYPKTGRRACRVCHKLSERRRLQNPAAAERNRERARKWRKENANHRNRLRRNAYARYKAKLEALKPACIKCGETHPACLDFHHRDPSQKLFSVGVQFGKYPWHMVQAEVAKCDVLCANCHRKHHALERTILTT